MKRVSEVEETGEWKGGWWGCVGLELGSPRVVGKDKGVTQRPVMTLMDDLQGWERSRDHC